MIGWLAAAATAVGTAGTLILEPRSARHGRAAKMLAASGFVVVAIVVGALDSEWGRIVVLALVLCWAGDLLLTYPGTRPFLGGLGAFLAGHVAFVVAFAARGVNTTTFALTAVAAVLLLTIVLPWIMPHVSGVTRVPVVAYTLVISAMLVMATATHGFDQDWRLPVAGAAFYASDLSVARNRFVAPGPSNRLWGLPLYFGAQLLLAWSAGG